MVSFRQLAFGLLSLQAALAADTAAVEEDVEQPTQSPKLRLGVSVSFPQSEIFGVKLVNGHATQALISFTNNEQGPVTVKFIGGSLWTPLYGVEGAPPQQIIRNLTLKSYEETIPSMQEKSLTYSFTTELHPQDLVLNLAAVVIDSKEAYYTVQAYNETVSVVEAPTSIFDPQIIFLYLVLAAAFAGTSYFIYTTWIATFLPQQKRSRQGKADRAKTATPRAKKTEASATGVESTTPSKGYDESWIPAHHIQRPETKRTKSGTPAGKGKSKAV